MNLKNLIIIDWLFVNANCKVVIIFHKDVRILLLMDLHNHLCLLKQYHLQFCHRLCFVLLKVSLLNQANHPVEGQFGQCLCQKGNPQNLILVNWYLRLEVRRLKFEFFQKNLYPKKVYYFL